MTAWAADFSAAQLNAGQLIGAGYIGAVRYIVGAGKGISDAEFRSLTTTPGFALALVNETYGQAAQGGYNVGRAEALAAFARADTLGWPKTRPIYFVCEDPNWMTQPSWPNIEQYLRGVLSVAPVSRVGDYGSAQQIAHMMALGLVTFGWPVETWPGNPVGCHLRQMYNPVPGAPHNFGGQVDPNMILSPDWGQWSAVIPPPASTQPPPPPQENVMAFGPTGNRVDVCFVAANGAIIHRWGTPDNWATTAVEERVGKSTDVAAKILQQGWLADGSAYVIIVEGSDHKAYLAKNVDGTWSGFTPSSGAVAA